MALTEDHHLLCFFLSTQSWSTKVERVGKDKLRKVPGCRGSLDISG
jgi:hypothetical protein